MFDIGAMELLLIAAVALLIIGPKDLPIAMRTAGKWIAQLRSMTSHFRVGIDAMIREAEIQEQEKTWAEKNAEIMREHPPETVHDGDGEKTEAERDDDSAQAAGETQIRPPSETPSLAEDSPAGDGSTDEDREGLSRSGVQPSVPLDGSDSADKDRRS